MDRQAVIIPYRKGRVDGAFTITAQAESRVRAEFDGTYCGTRHTGSVFFRERGVEVAEEYIRVPGSLGKPTRPATSTIKEAAQRVVLCWAPEHAGAFDEADLEAARAELASGEREANGLREQLAEAERKVAAAQTKVRLLGGAAS